MASAVSSQRAETVGGAAGICASVREFRDEGWGLDLLLAMRDSSSMLTLWARNGESEPKLGVRVYICFVIENVFEKWRKITK